VDMGWRPFIALCAVPVCVATLGLAMAGSSRAVAAGQESAGQPSVQELAERLLGFPQSDGQTASLQLLPGQIASQLPVSPALPAGARVVGSLVRNAGTPMASVSVVIDAPGDRATIQAFYQKELAGKGWNPLPPGPQAHGFQPGSQPGGPSIFCSPQGSAWLSVNVYGGQSGSSDVRINTNGQIPNQCHPPNAAAPAPPFSSNSLIPPLYAPEGVATQPGSTGGGPGRWVSDGTATTDQKAGPLEQHFAQQLQAAKWTRLDGRDDGVLAWSAWKLPDGDWQALLYVMNGPGQNRRILHVDAQSATAQQATAPGTAFATGQAVAVSAPVAAAVPAVPAARPAAPSALATPPAKPGVTATPASPTS